MGKNLVTGGGVMQLSNDTSKNSTSPPYLVKNERSLGIRIRVCIGCFLGLESFCPFENKS